MHLSDVLGASMLVDALNNETGGIATESTVRSPFIWSFTSTRTR